VGDKTSIYMSEDLAAKIGPMIDRLGVEGGDKKRGLSAAVTILTDRYMELVARETRVLRELFDEGEKNLMLNNALSTLYEPAAIIPGAVLADTQDEDPEVFALYGVDRKVLLAKLRGLNLGQQFALVDWLEDLRAHIAPTPAESSK
jgi:hypothetical protein